MEKQLKSQEFKRKYVPLNYSKLAEVITADLNSNKQKYKFFNKYTKDNVVKYLQNPQQNEKNLREMSQFLYNVSSHYKRLVNYFAKMPLLYYNVSPYGINPDKMSKTNIKTFTLNMFKVLDVVENMNIKHEFSKILTTAFKEDVFYGYEYSNSTSYFIQKLDPDYCKISSIEDGIYNFSFDFSYFSNNEDKLKMYASEFKTLYEQYKNDSKKRWIELDSEKTICIKINEDLEYCFPPFASVFEYLFDIEDYKALQKSKTEVDNYKLLVMTVPMREDSDVNNDFKIELDDMQYFYDKTAEVLPDGVGLAMSPTEINAITFDKDTVDKDRVGEAVKQFWNGAGVGNSLFGDGANSGATLTLSIQTDEEIVFTTLRQIERWINRKLKFISGITYKFKVNMLNITRFNEDKVRDGLLKSAQYGVPVKMDLAVAHGLTPSEVIGKMFMENTVLGLDKTWLPLMSSHTLSNGAGGAPKTAGTGTEGSTEATEENDSNNPDNRA